MPRVKPPPYPLPSEAACPKCPARDAAGQFKAHLHWLRDFQDADELRAHLEREFSTSPQGREFKEGNIYAVLQWRRGVMQDFSRDLDESGAKVQPWETWAMAQANPPCQTVTELWQRLEQAGYLKKV